MRLVTPLAATPWFPIRHAVLSLRRPGNQTRVILLAVGLGSFFVLGVRALQDNLIAEAVIDLLSDSQKALAMGERGRRWVEAAFTWESIFERTRELSAAVAERV